MHVTVSEEVEKILITEYHVHTHPSGNTKFGKYNKLFDSLYFCLPF